MILKKRIDSGDPVTRSKPGTQALDRAEFENYATTINNNDDDDDYKIKMKILTLLMT